jgi:hypothetical protein
MGMLVVQEVSARTGAFLPVFSCMQVASLEQRQQWMWRRI